MQGEQLISIGNKKDASNTTVAKSAQYVGDVHAEL